jgi:hypothetical protein
MLVGDIPDPYLPLQYQLTGSHLPGHPQGQLESSSHHFKSKNIKTENYKKFLRITYFPHQALRINFFKNLIFGLLNFQRVLILYHLLT